jgi:predicted DNA-binding transcriptional regulator AlpA
MNAIRLRQVATKIGLSRASIYRRLQQDATFPRAFSLGGRAMAFDADEIDSWLAAQKSAAHSSGGAK